MTDHPIIFSASMIRTLLSGRKTQTRRLAWRQCRQCEGGNRRLFLYPDGPIAICDSCRGSKHEPSPWQRVEPGDRLWVRETWAPDSPDDPERAIYRADNLTAQTVTLIERRSQRWRPPTHMPRWASRLTLVVTAAKIERLQKISEDDARAEGFDPPFIVLADPITHASTEWPAFMSARDCFAYLWDQLHGNGAGDANPDVVVITFCVVKKNIDAMAQAA